MIVAAKKGKPTACMRADICLNAAITWSPTAVCVATSVLAVPMSFTPSNIIANWTPLCEMTSRSTRPNALGPSPSARMRLPPAAALEMAMLAVDGLVARRFSTRSGHLVVVGQHNVFLLNYYFYLSFPSVSLPRPSVILSPIIANVLADFGTQASTALMKYLDENE